MLQQPNQSKGNHLPFLNLLPSLPEALTFQILPQIELPDGKQLRCNPLLLLSLLVDRLTGVLVCMHQSYAIALQRLLLPLFIDF
jgi:hypothetical protein